ncbi:MAG TPA: helix-hairpin-helix domain-containing protein [Candidatus Humimicrobiaceae bacterium]|nr:helix-hairpin-helix domain-containing protein [Candidatus Humimicrobiaceae bacterium]
MTKKIFVIFVIVLIFGAGGFFYWWQNPELIQLGKAQVSLTLEEKPKEEVEQGLLREEIETIKEESDIEPGPAEPEPVQTLTLEELQAMLDDIARQIDILAQEVAELIEEEEEEKEFEGCQENQLNINIAFPEGLEELYRVGPVLAQRIIEERQKELFYTLDDLARVQGIGEKTVAGIKGQGIACAGVLEEGVASLALEQDNEEEEEIKEKDICWVNINTASASELQKITGVGPVIAQRIIEVRPFYSLSDLIRVSGIGETTLQKIIAQGCAYALGYTGNTGGAPPPVPVSYPEIIISEVQIEGNDTNHDFIELYNSENSDTDISGYKLRKRTSTGSESSIRVFPSGSLISAKGYYLWASSKDENYPSLINADASTTQTLASKNSIALLAPDNTIISALAWASSTNPFMEISPFPENPGVNESLGRIWLGETEEYKNTGDNSVDFEIQSPTPKAQNQSPETEPVVEYSLTIEIIGGGTTTPAFGTSTYGENEEVIVTAFPEEGWRFIGWTGDLASEETVMKIVMDEDKSIIANFGKEEEPEPPTNFLLNKFFEEWQSGTSTAPPDNWLWSGTLARINQSSDGLIGNYSAELTLTSADWWGFYQYGKTMNSSTAYYAQCWVKGIGVLRLGIKYPGSAYVYYGDVIALNTDEWTFISVSRIPANEGGDGGLRLNVKYDEDQGIPSGSKLFIGAAWLSNAPPPDDWLD